ncbi:hypothetical protein GH714_000206 [Hevea brasiliensis]|uniref:Uncharacterized protein n=1 Tax=Hevea brasiliensis TaxID=3981 RepID=A0A6A6KTZ2_HEVBR|nr:hypothetical protein GH714_000206 [Hevea brasiliensis]
MFLTLLLRLVPSICGFFLILLHILTIAGAVSGCAVWYAAHMVATVLTAIFQGSISYYAYVEGDVSSGNPTAMKRTAKVQQEEDLKDCPWRFQL